MQEGLFFIDDFWNMAYNNYYVKDTRWLYMSNIPEIINAAYPMMMSKNGLILKTVCTSSMGLVSIFLLYLLPQQWRESLSAT